MQRRDFLKNAAIGAAAGGLITSGCGEGPGARRAARARTTDRVRWRLVSSFTRSLDTLYGTVEGMARRVAELTNGNFEIRAYQGGEIVPALEVLESVQTGSVEMGHSASYYYIGKNPALAFDCTVPFGLTARQQNAWLYEGGGLDLMRGLFSDFNIINFPGGNTGVQMGGWFRNPIGSLADLQGLKMRIPGLGGEVMDRLGVTVQVLPGGEVYVALERGAIDAAEWVGPYDDEKLGLYQVAKNYYYPGWWEPGASISYYINRQAYERLPKEYQAALATACTEANMAMMSQYDARNMMALRRLEEKGVQLHPFPDDIMRAARTTARDIMEERAAADAAYRKVYESFKTFRRDSARWFMLAEQTYSNFAYREEGRG